MKLNTTLAGAIALIAMFLIGCQTRRKPKRRRPTSKYDAQIRAESHAGAGPNAR